MEHPVEARNRLRWIRLRTTRIGDANDWRSVHDVDLLPELVPNASVSERQAAECSSERWSPLFVVDSPGASPNLGAKVTGVFWLLFDTRPVELAAQLAKKIPAGVEHGLFLTHGMASVVLVLPSPSPELDPLVLFEGRPFLHAIEQWKAKEGRITSWKVLRDQSNSPTGTDVTAGEAFHTAIPEVVQRQIQENELVVRESIQLCQKYRPSYLVGISDLCRRASLTIDDIRNAPKTGNIRWEKLQSDAYSLGHLNSMMAYFLSQGLSGTPPLLDYRGLLPSCSVFGVATAYRAVWAITHFIEDGFVRFDILSAMNDRYFTAKSADYHQAQFIPVLDDVQPSATYGNRKAPGHVNLFSGRLGFHSSTWAVAAPVDSIHVAAEPGWNLLTLSHELLHVHVDRLLEFLLTPNHDKEPSLTRDQLYLKMVHLAHENASRDNLTIIDRIRQKVARYILFCAAARSGDKSPLSQLPRNSIVMTTDVTEPEQFRNMVVAFWRRLTEYIVHILDFYYFYCGDVDRFFSLVIPSWASIPSVYDDVGHYIMRCLLAVSTHEMDPNVGTSLVEPLDFDASLGKFTAGISRLSTDGNCGHLTALMTKFLSDAENKEFLRCEFNRAKALVWLTLMYFYCRPLRMYFELGREVRGGVVAEDVLCPEFEFGTVKENLPVSPIAFLFKYLSKDYAEPASADEVPTEAASIWLFSWIASCRWLEGGNNAS